MKWLKEIERHGIHGTWAALRRATRQAIFKAHKFEKQ
jgi:hypothetical protein